MSATKPVARESRNVLSLGELLRVRAIELPDRPYLTVSGRGYTFGELDARSDAVAAALHLHGVQAGDRVALLAPNSPEVVELFFGLAKLGATQVPLNAALKGEFLRYQLNQSQASVMVADGEGAGTFAAVAHELPDLRLCVLPDNDQDGAELAGIARIVYAEFAGATSASPAVSVNPADTMTIIYTSGTTGLPKGCLLSHGYYQRAARAVLRELETAIRAHPKVVDVAVHAVASALTEDDVKACIVLNEGVIITPEELFAFFCEQLPSYAIPRYVEFLDELPRTAIGRTMKYKLRERPIDERVWDFEQLGLRPNRSERGGAASRQAENPQHRSHEHDERWITERHS